MTHFCPVRWEGKSAEVSERASCHWRQPWEDTSYSSELCLRLDLLSRKGPRGQGPSREWPWRGRLPDLMASPSTSVRVGAVICTLLWARTRTRETHVCVHFTRAGFPSRFFPTSLEEQHCPSFVTRNVLLLLLNLLNSLLCFKDRSPNKYFQI